MNEVIAMAFARRVDGGDMTLEQVPIPYQEEVGSKINQGEIIN